MIRRLAGMVVVICLGLAGECFGHLLDAYLQSAKVSIGSNRIDIDLTLTPGVAIAAGVLKSIDSDGNGVISEAEQAAYAARVRDDLSLTLDGEAVALAVVKVSFPEVGRMKEGVGEIRVSLGAPVGGRGGVRHLVLENRHATAISLYLANCLVPKDRTVRIIAQDRTYDQSLFRVDYEQRSAGAAAATTAPAGGGNGDGMRGERG